MAGLRPYFLARSIIAEPSRAFFPTLDDPQERRAEYIQAITTPQRDTGFGAFVINTAEKLALAELLGPLGASFAEDSNFAPGEQSTQEVNVWDDLDFSGLNDYFDSVGLSHPDFNDFGISDVVGVAQQYLPMLNDGPSGNSGTLPGTSVTPVGAFGMAGAAAAGGLALRSLWGVLRAGGARFSTIVTQSGVRARLTDLWPAVRKYGPQAVATALGIGAAELATLLAQAPAGAGPRKRRRGISARDVSTTKRVVGFVNQMSRQIGCVSRPRARYRRARR